MSSEPPHCRLCGSREIKHLGIIPDSDLFAGRILAQSVSGGGLWRCSACLSMFRHPVLTPAAYLELYGRGVADAWHADQARLDLTLVRARIAQRGGVGSVLDVGCGSGGFLSTLPTEWKKFGIEPSVAAAALAQGQGVQIVGQTLKDLSPQARFDVITIIDVIEHVVDPAGLLDQVLSHLAPAGWLIISTGDPENIFWRRLLRSRFWYSTFPEHISFPSAGFFGKWQQSRGLQHPVIVRTRYCRRPMWRLVLASMAQTAYWVSPAAINAAGRWVQWLRRAHRPHRKFFSSGGQGVFTDHQVVAIQARDVTRFPVS